MAKLPEPESIEQLRRIQPEIVTFKAGTEVSRVFFTDVDYPSAWNEFRCFGPTRSRFDHHIADKHGEACGQDRGIMYLASGGQAAKTCLAEVFQEKRVIDRNSKLPVYVGFALDADIQLLDLSGNFVTKLGASTAIHSGPRAKTRRWAQRLYDAYQQIDGLLYCSSMNGNAPAIALFERGADAIPASNLIHRELRDSAMASVVTLTAREIGYQVV
jgi:hypothetical protein